MCAKKSSDKKPRRGRPPLKKSIPVSEYKFIIEQPHINDAVNEIVITEPMTINSCLKTFKSLGAENILFNWTKEGLVIVAEVLDGKNELVSTPNTKRKIFLQLKASEIYSYYCSEELTMQVNNITNLEEFSDDLEESSDRIILYYTGANNSLNIDIHQKSLGSYISEDYIDITRIIKPPMFIDCPDLINDIHIEFRDIKACELKKYLGKKNKKQANICEFVAKGNSITLDFKTAIEKMNTSKFNIRDNNHLVNYKPDEIFHVNLPKSDIKNFCLHLKKPLLTMYISEKYLFLVCSNSPGIYMKYLIELIN